VQALGGFRHRSDRFAVQDHAHFDGTPPSRRKTCRPSPWMPLPCSVTEFAVVAMSMCCFRTGFGRGYAHNPVRAAYTAMTRGTQQLWLPAGALDELGQSIARFQANRTDYRRSKITRR